MEELAELIQDDVQRKEEFSNIDHSSSNYKKRVRRQCQKQFYARRIGLRKQGSGRPRAMDEEGKIHFLFMRQCTKFINFCEICTNYSRVPNITLIIQKSKIKWYK